MTADDLLRNDIPHKSTELVRGRLIVREPPSTFHGRVQSNLNVIVGAFVRAHGLGAVFGQDTGFKIGSNPDTVRAPDLAFVKRDRLALVGKRGYSELAPDLAAEILSPGDRPGEVKDKVADWLAAGVGIVWVIDPDTRTAVVHRVNGSVSHVPEAGVLDGETLLPGFTCALADLFD